MINWASQDILFFTKKPREKPYPLRTLLTREEIIEIMEPDRNPGTVIRFEDLPVFPDPPVRNVVYDYSDPRNRYLYPKEIWQKSIFNVDEMIRGGGKYFKTKQPSKNQLFPMKKDDGYSSKVEAGNNETVSKNKEDKRVKTPKPKKASFLSSLPFRTPEMRDRSNDVFDADDTPDNRLFKSSFYVKEEHNLVTDYLEDIAEFRPSLKQKQIIEKVLKEGRAEKLRHETTGSYPPNSVDEKLLEVEREHILRFAWKGRKMKMRALLRDPAHWKDVNRTDSCYRTALHFAASWGDKEILEMLIDIPGVDLNIRDDEGKTPLYKATEAKSYDCVQTLLDNGANPLIVAHDNRTPFDWALQNIGDNDIDIIQEYIVHGILREEIRQKNICTALHRLCYAVVPIRNTAGLLISGGVDVNGGDCYGVRPLMLAAENENLELVEILLRTGANPTLVDAGNKEALNYCDIRSPCYRTVFKAIQAYHDLTEEEEFEAAFSLVDSSRAQTSMY